MAILAGANLSHQLTNKVTNIQVGKGTISRQDENESWQIYLKMQYYTKPFLLLEKRLQYHLNYEELLPHIKFIKEWLNIILNSVFELSECDITCLEIINEDLEPIMIPCNEDNNYYCIINKK